MPIFNVVCCICGGPVEDTWEVWAMAKMNADGIKMYDCACCDLTVEGIAPADYKPLEPSDDFLPVRLFPDPRG